MQHHLPANPDAAAIISWIRTSLTASPSGDAEDPLSNQVRQLAYKVSTCLHDGTVSLKTARDAIWLLGADAFADRARRFRLNHEAGLALSENDYAAIIETLPEDFDAFKSRINEIKAGIVFTAHPTFSHHQEFRSAVGDFFAAPEGSGADTLKSTYLALSARDHRAPSLDDEHQQVKSALTNARLALRDFTTAILRHAQQKFPARWRELEPIALSLASWVGYDLDGRTDIRWFETIRIRLEEKAAQLSYYGEQLSECDAGNCADELAALRAELTLAAAQTWDHARLFSKDLDNPEALVAAANALTADYEGRLTSLVDIRNRLLALSTHVGDKHLQVKLHTLATEMKAYGLGIARIHLRINAAQVKSVLRAELDLGPDQAFFDRTVLDLTASKFKATPIEKVNFASLFAEKMTARRQFMLCAQLLKHVDADIPIRFLIAECEAPATVMGAVYLAKKYGVDRNVDISPLFETPDGIEKGGRLLERLLAEESYRQYVRKRGILSIQLGFSDSGRFMGQLPANMAIERVHIQLAREMSRWGLKGVRAILFNTHGESMGRGCFPGTLRQRFDFAMTPWARARFSHENVALTAESSFQGGDGYLHFETPTIARSTIAAMLEWGIATPEQDQSDRFYGDINFSWDLFRAVKGWQEDLFADPSYRTILTSLGPNLLPLTGSRKVKRDSGASKGDVAKSLRAIPHNAILQQLAVPANVLGGLGAGGAREPDRFSQLIEHSGRARALLAIARHARERTSISVLRAYASLFDPAYWIIRARLSKQPSDAEAFTVMGEMLADGQMSHGMEFFANRVSKDRRLLDDFLFDQGATAEKPFHKDLYALHILRIAICAHVFYLTARLPEFSSRHDVSMPALLTLVLQFRFKDAAIKIADIFPSAGLPPEAFSSISEPADNMTDIGAYPDIHENIVQPLLSADESIKEATRNIIHFYDAFG